jgi:hypothetical protein
VLSSLQVDTPEPTAEELADMRARICVGMKRYFHGKNVEGLLSNAVSYVPGARLATRCVSVDGHCKALTAVG